MERPALIYIYDALCGWCYGFSPVVRKLYATYHDRMDFAVVSGGMITGHRVQPIAAMADYIREASLLLEEVTGVVPSETFFAEILAKGAYISNSLPPAIALAILKEHSPQEQVPLAQAIQRLFYEQGQDLNQVETYLPLVAEKGLDAATFKQKFDDPAYAEKAQQEFKQVQAWGIDGFPALLGKKEGALILLCHGFEPYHQVNASVEQLLGQ